MTISHFFPFLLIPMSLLDESNLYTYPMRPASGLCMAVVVERVFALVQYKNTQNKTLMFGPTICLL